MKRKRREWLVQRIADLGLTQDEAAEKIGCHVRALKYWISGDWRPEYENAVKAAEVLRFKSVGLDWTAFYEDSDIVLEKMRRIA